MYYSDYNPKLNAVIDLLEQKPSVSPFEIELKLQCSESEVRKMIDQLRLVGYNIQWSKLLYSYLLFDEVKSIPA